MRRRRSAWRGELRCGELTWRGDAVRHFSALRRGEARRGAASAAVGAWLAARLWVRWQKIERRLPCGGRRRELVRGRSQGARARDHGSARFTVDRAVLAAVARYHPPRRVLLAASIHIVSTRPRLTARFARLHDSLETTGLPFVPCMQRANCVRGYTRSNNRRPVNPMSSRTG